MMPVDPSVPNRLPHPPAPFNDAFGKVQMAMLRILPACVLMLLLAAPGTALAQGKKKPGAQMDYGPFLAATYISAKPKKNKAADDTAYRGVAVPFTLPGDVQAGVIFDTEMLRYMTVWTGGFIKYEGVVFDGAAVVRIRARSASPCLRPSRAPAGRRMAT